MKYVTFNVTRIYDLVVEIPDYYDDDDAYAEGICDEQAIEVNCETLEIKQSASTDEEIELFKKEKEKAKDGS